MYYIMKQCLCCNISFQAQTDGKSKRSVRYCDPCRAINKQKSIERGKANYKARILTERAKREKTKEIIPNNHFKCGSCENIRHLEFKSLENGRSTRCRICLSFKNKRKRNPNIQYELVERDYLTYHRLKKNNLFICRGCNEEMSSDLNHNQGVCKPCSLEGKRDARRRDREKKGGIYQSTAIHQAHVIAWKMTFVLDGHIDLYKRSFVHDAHVVAHKKHHKPKSMIQIMTDDEVEEHYNKIGKPWNNPRISQAKRYRLQYKLDMDFRLKEITKSRMKKKVYRRDIDGNLRNKLNQQKTVNYLFGELGYTSQELREHIESKFIKGMSWARFKDGEIHIDHIIPVTLFDMSNEHEIKQCWGLSNLQPLWAADNIAKSDRLPDGRRVQELSIEERSLARAMYVLEKTAETV